MKIVIEQVVSFGSLVQSNHVAHPIFMYPSLYRGYSAWYIPLLSQFTSDFNFLFTVFKGTPRAKQNAKQKQNNVRKKIVIQAT